MRSAKWASQSAMAAAGMPFLGFAREAKLVAALDYLAHNKDPQRLISMKTSAPDPIMVFKGK